MKIERFALGALGTNCYLLINEESKEVVVVENKNQEAAPAPTIETGSTSKSIAIEEIKQFKELLDAGIITQEEFDAKKKQLLGL